MNRADLLNNSAALLSTNARVREFLLTIQARYREATTDAELEAASDYAVHFPTLPQLIAAGACLNAYADVVAKLAEMLKRAAVASLADGSTINLPSAQEIARLPWSLAHNVTGD